MRRRRAFSWDVEEPSHGASKSLLMGRRRAFSWDVEEPSHRTSKSLLIGRQRAFSRDIKGPSHELPKSFLIQSAREKIEHERTLQKGSPKEPNSQQPLFDASLASVTFPKPCSFILERLHSTLWHHGISPIFSKKALDNQYQLGTKLRNSTTHDRTANWVNFAQHGIHYILFT